MGHDSGAERPRAGRGAAGSLNERGRSRPIHYSPPSSEWQDTGGTKRRPITRQGRQRRAHQAVAATPETVATRMGIRDVEVVREMEGANRALRHLPLSRPPFAASVTAAGQQPAGEMWVVMMDERAVVSQGRTPYYQVMPKTVTDVLADALRLEPDARAEVAAELLASLDGPADPDADAAWDVEIERRIEAIESGQTRLEPWPEVKRRIERDVLGR